MRIVLVYNRLLIQNNWTVLKAQDKNVGVNPPLSLAYVASVIQKCGHEVHIIDAVAEKLSIEQVVEKVRGYKPDFLGFTVTTYGFSEVLHWVREIKKSLRLPVIAGGWHLFLYPEETMAHAEFDYAVLGYAHDILPDFLAALEKGGDLSKVKGICFRENGRVVNTGCLFGKIKFDDVPFPARNLLPNNAYYNILSRGRKYTGLISTIGCPFRCIFCELRTMPYDARSAVNLVDEVEACCRQFGIDEFDIFDSSFTVSRKRVVEFCQELAKRNLKIFWTMRTRTDCVDEELLKLVRQAGCRVIMYGIESGNPDILKTLRKDNNIENIRKVVKVTKKLGISCLGFFMVGSPGESRETVKQTIKLAKELPLDYVQFTRVLPFANTELYQMLVDDTKIDYWREYTLRPESPINIPMVRTSLSVDEVFTLVRKAYLEYYFSPRTIMRMLGRIRSIFELKKGVLAALEMLWECRNSKTGG